MAGVALSRRDPQLALRLVEGVDGDEAALERAAALIDLSELDEAERLLHTLASDEPRIRFGVLVCNGSITRARAQYGDAERRFREALAYAEQQFGAESLEAGGSLNALGMTFKYSGRFDEGLECYTRALAILERAVGETPDTASLYHNLGGLEHARRNFAEAEPYARRSVEIRRRTAGDDHPSVAEDEAAWAAILQSLGRQEEAEQLLRHALEILERTFGPDHPEVAGAWNNLASALQRREAYDEAHAAYLRALEAKERTLGPEHPAVGITLNNLGVNARRRGAPEEAEAYYRRALAALDGRVEPDHPNLLLTLGNYARLLRTLGRESEAAELERQREESQAAARLAGTE